MWVASRFLIHWLRTHWWDQRFLILWLGNTSSRHWFIDRFLFKRDVFSNAVRHIWVITQILLLLPWCGLLIRRCCFYISEGHLSILFLASSWFVYLPTDHAGSIGLWSSTLLYPFTTRLYHNLPPLEFFDPLLDLLFWIHIHGDTQHFLCPGPFHLSETRF